MSVDVILPWFGTDPYRVAARRWVETGLAGAGQRSIGIGRAPTPWCKGRAISNGLKQSLAEVIVIHDADVWCDGLDAAVAAVLGGMAEWAIPHGNVIRLTKGATSHVLNGEPFNQKLGFEPPIYQGHAGGGIVVVRRDVWEDCPMDPRFVGWGQEDDSWALALTKLHGRPWRGDEALWHLWHPPQPRESRLYGSRPSRMLWMRYKAASEAASPGRMRGLVDEARVAFAA